MNMTPVIPAQPGFFWLTAYLLDQAENDFAVRVPVVAWRVEEDGAHPVLPATADIDVNSADDRLWSALLLPHGQILEPILKDPWEPRLDNVDQWLAEIRKYREWEASQPAKASSAQPSRLLRPRISAGGHGGGGWRAARRGKRGLRAALASKDKTPSTTR
jgi:hypothetical protein